MTRFRSLCGHFPRDLHSRVSGSCASSWPKGCLQMAVGIWHPEESWQNQSAQKAHLQICGWSCQVEAEQKEGRWPEIWRNKSKVKEDQEQERQDKTSTQCGRPGTEPGWWSGPSWSGFLLEVFQGREADSKVHVSNARNGQSCISLQAHVRCGHGALSSQDLRL